MPSNTTENATALAIVVIGNWLLTHLATEWTMPPEVQSSVQALIVAGFGGYLAVRVRRKARAEAARQKATDNAAADAPPATATATQVSP